MADDVYKRLTVRSLKDKASGAYSVDTYDRDMKAIERALKSALPKDAFYHMKPKDINYTGGNPLSNNQIGKLREDFYVKEQYAQVAHDALSRAVSKMLFDNYNINSNKYSLTKARNLTNDESQLVKELAEMNKNNKENKEGEGARFTKSTLLKILGAITAVADIARRILSSVLNLATQSVQDTITAHNLGTTYEAVRQYRHVETKHGLKEGTITGALADIQNKFGNITTLDEKSLEALAVVLGGKIEEMAKMGVGASNPEKILESIIDTFNEKANAGVNSIGQYVGEQQARRELYSYLLKISPQMADIFATMQEEQHNINSLFRNQADTFAEWKNIPSGRGFGNDPAHNNVVVELGEQWNIVKETIEQVRDAIAVTLAPALMRILRRIADSRVGMTQSEKEARNRENKQANTDFINSAKATMALMQGNWDNLSPEQQARYWALEDAVRQAETANKGTGLFNKKIVYAVPTQEELQVATQSILYEKAKERAQLGKDESAYRYLDDITEEEIQATAESNAYDIDKARDKYNKAKSNYITSTNDPKARLKASQEAVKEAKKNIRLNEVVSQANRDAKVVTQQDWLMTLMAVEQVFGVDFEHDAKGKEVGLNEALKRAVKAGYIKFDKLGYDVVKPFDETDISQLDSDFPSFWTWAYQHDPQFFNAKVLNKRADKMSFNSRFDPYYDWTLLHQDYGADFEKIADKLPSGYNYRNAGIFSVDETSDNGIITHKIILDLNNNGKQEAKDVVLESFVTNRAGYVGTITDKVEINNSRVTTYNKPASSTYGGRMTGAQK
jgi:hypothetical protein